MGKWVRAELHADAGDEDGWLSQAVWPMAFDVEVFGAVGASAVVTLRRDSRALLSTRRGIHNAQC
jgi:hypothetical protein